jgi:hypothetical protein
MYIVESIIIGNITRPSGPGGRYDNDFSEISKIEIIPTANKLTVKDPYLPRANETKNLAL